MVNVYKNKKAFELNQPSIKTGVSCIICKHRKLYCANNSNRDHAKCLFVSDVARNMQLPIRSIDENGVRRVSVVLNNPRELTTADEVLQQMYKKYSR